MGEANLAAPIQCGFWIIPQADGKRTANGASAVAGLARPVRRVRQSLELHSSDGLGRWSPSIAATPCDLKAQPAVDGPLSFLESSSRITWHENVRPHLAHGMGLVMGRE